MMKKIEAIIRKSKFKLVKKALTEAGFEFFSYWLVRDITEEHEKRVYRGVEYEPTASERILMVMVLQDEDVDKATQIIITNGTTRGAGDGRIIITNLESVLRIRTENDEDQSTSY